MELRVNCIIAEIGLTPKVMAGRIKLSNFNNSLSPKLSNSNKVPVMFNPVISVRTYPKKYEIRIAEKKEGTYIPKIEINNVRVYSSTAVTNTSGTNRLILNVANQNIYIGMVVTGTGIPSSTLVTASIGDEVTLSKVTTQAVTSVTFTGKARAVISGAVRILDRGRINASSNIEVNNIITLT